MMLTSKDIRMILQAIHPGFGYSEDKEISRLQAKLSIMLQVAVERELRAKSA